jgi:hypothetical protein
VGGGAGEGRCLACKGGAKGGRGRRIGCRSAAGLSHLWQHRPRGQRAPTAQ